MAYPRTRAEIEAYPYAQLGVVVESRRPGIAVLAEYLGANYRWVAADAFSIVTQPNGRIVALVLGELSIRSSLSGADPLGNLSQGSASGYQRWVTDAVTSMSGLANEAPRRLDCTLDPGELSTISVAGREIETWLYEEHCRDRAGESSLMRFWIDKAGRMRRVYGRLQPGGLSLRLDILKTPA